MDRKQRNLCPCSSFFKKAEKGKKNTLASLIFVQSISIISSKYSLYYTIVVSVVILWKSCVQISREIVVH